MSGTSDIDLSGKPALEGVNLRGLARETLKLLALAACVAFMVWIAIQLPRALGRPTPIWAANAVVLASLLVSPQRRWAGVLMAALLGNVAADLVLGDSVAMTLFYSIANTVEVGLTALILRRALGPELDFSRGRHLLVFCVVAGMVMPLASSAAASAIHRGHEVDWLKYMVTWAAADGLGVMIIVPTLLTLRQARAHLADAPIRLPGVLALALLTLVTAAAFSQKTPVLFAIAPVLLLVVFQMEMLGAAVGVMIIAMVGIAAAVAGLGPTNGDLIQSGGRLIIAQVFLAIMLLTSLPTAAVLAQRRRLQAELADALDRAEAAAAEAAELTRRAKLAEHVAADSEVRMRRLAENVTDILLKTNIDGTLLYISSSIEASLGYKPEELIGKPNLNMVHPEDRQKVTEVAMNALRTKGRSTPLRVEYRGLTKDGRTVWLESRPGIITDPATGRITAITDIVRDITERKAMEQDLENARREAEAAAAVKSEFLANMSHELRTPLTSVLGFTRLAQEQDDLSPETRAHIDKAARAGVSLLTTVNDILDFSKLEAGQVEIRPRPCDAAAVCRETLELFEEQAAQKGLTLSFAAGAGMPDCLAVDPDRLRQLLLNLVGNAVKFSPSGAVTVKAGWRSGRLRVSVRDNGPGIAAEQQERLFRRFSQVDGSSTRRHGGTGLGLAICRGLVEAMGGEISVKSREGHGAVFSFQLAAPRAAAVQAGPNGEAALIAPGCRVLVTDDHVVNRELVRAVLTPLGAVVSEAASGTEAVEMAAVAAFDLILMDLRMPGLDGLGAVAAIRGGQGLNANIPILAFSAGSEALDEASLDAAGFDGLVAKPMMPVDLVAAVAWFTAPGPGEALRAVG